MLFDADSVHTLSTWRALSKDRDGRTQSEPADPMRLALCALAWRTNMKANDEMWRLGLQRLSLAIAAGRPPLPPSAAPSLSYTSLS
eukprot:353245-Chlamydomonas_euryale.AAC.1